MSGEGNLLRKKGEKKGKRGRFQEGEV